MKTASSMAELENMILAEMTTAMNVARIKAEKDTKNEVESFYSQGSPTIYKRTGKLGKSTKSHGTFKSGKSVEFVIWLDRTYSYTVPNPAFIERGYESYFSTPMVFDAAEAGTANIKGKPGFWARSFEKIKSDTNDALGMYFSKI